MTIPFEPPSAVNETDIDLRTSTVDVLVVEDDPDAAALLVHQLGRVATAGLEVRTADSIAAALNAMGERLPDVVLLDLSLPDASGLMGLLSIRAFAPDLAVVIFTGSADDDLLQLALSRGAQDYLLKGETDPHEIARSIRKAVSRATAEIARRSSTDSLTGLPNRISVEHQIDLALAAGRPTTLLFIDLDGFGAVNDSHGHSLGDLVLRTIADRLVHGLGQAEMIGRFGGDEFLVVLHDADDEEALDLAAGVISLIQRPLRTHEGTHRLSASIGIATSNTAATAGELVSHADAAMQSAKQRGACARLFDREARQRLGIAVRLGPALAEALDNGQLTMHYQPVVSLADRQSAGVEALIRWRHPLEGDVPPSLFVPYAERTPLIHDLGQFVVRTALTEMLDHTRAERFQLAINVSMAEICTDDYAARLMRVCEEIGFPPERLVVEVTETLIANDLAGCAAMLGVLADQGVKIALDDFGSGFASIATLRQLPLHHVKLDKSLVDDIDQPRERDFAERTIALIHSLGFTIVGEGVEHEAQLTTLAELGCDLAQGFLLGRPAPSTPPL